MVGLMVAIPIDQRVALRVLLVHPTGAVIVWWPSTSPVTVVSLGLLPQNDWLLADIEVVLTELVLHDDRNTRGQSLRSEHVQLAGLSLFMENTSNEDG